MLEVLPLVFVLLGLIFYVVLAGADFGAGVWQLLSGPGERGRRIREAAHHSVGPVWEANHVWLIFVLTVTWTAYPGFFGSVASTLGVVMFIVALGVILRGASYALRSGANERELTLIDGGFAVASLLTPFALGAAAGAIVVEAVPVGNAHGGLIASWTGPVQLLIGVMSVSFCAYLAAVYLAADCQAHGPADLVEAFRGRAMVAGAVSGLVAIAGLILIHSRAPSLYHGFTHGAALVLAILSFLSGAAVFGLVVLRRFTLARFGVGVPIAAVITTWALARYPTLLPGLSVKQAAAGHDTLVAVTVAVLAGAVLLFPALTLLFRLTLGGHLYAADATPTEAPAPKSRPLRSPLGRAAGIRIAVASFIIGLGLLNAADAAWAHLLGVIALGVFVLVGFATVVFELLAAPD